MHLTVCFTAPEFSARAMYTKRHERETHLTQNHVNVYSPCDLKPCTFGYQPDRSADARSRWAREPRTASGILPRVVWCIRCLLPLLPQPSAALLSQMATHAVRPPFTGDPRRNNNIPFLGRDPLHGRRSRGGAKRVHSTPVRAPSLPPTPY
jgi:hypothetical protein